jgi:hypothetical protein
MDFMSRRITCLIEEQEAKLKQPRARELAIEVERTQEGLKNLSMHERRAPTPEVIREAVFHLDLVNDPQPRSYFAKRR